MIFVEDLVYPEAPLLMNDGGWLVAEMVPGNGRLTKISVCGQNRSVFAEGGRPNGLLLDRKTGCIWVAETWNPSLIKLNPDGTVANTITEGDKPFLWPNDLVFGPDGYIYMTDSGLLAKDLITDQGLNQECWEGDMAGCLYRIHPETCGVECLDEGFRFTNGIAFGVDGKLYINEMTTGHIYRYDFNEALDKKIDPATRELFVSVIDKTGPSRIVGPDGMAFDEQGNLYVALFGQGHIAKVSPKGEITRSIVTRGSSPTNVAFGRAGSKKLYITEFQRGRLEVVDVEFDGYCPDFL